MKKYLVLASAVFALATLIGCSSDEGGEYKVEGPTAESNASVGQPVSAGGATTTTEEPIAEGKGGAPRGRSSKN